MLISPLVSNSRTAIVAGRQEGNAVRPALTLQSPSSTTSAITDVVFFRSSGPFMATVDAAGMVRLWNLLTRESIGEFVAVPRLPPPTGSEATQPPSPPQQLAQGLLSCHDATEAMLHVHPQQETCEEETRRSTQGEGSSGGNQRNKRSGSQTALYLLTQSRSRLVVLWKIMVSGAPPPRGRSRHSSSSSSSSSSDSSDEAMSSCSEEEQSDNDGHGDLSSSSAPQVTSIEALSMAHVNQHGFCRVLPLIPPVVRTTAITTPTVCCKKGATAVLLLAMPMEHRGEDHHQGDSVELVVFRSSSSSSSNNKASLSEKEEVQGKDEEAVEWPAPTRQLLDVSSLCRSSLPPPPSGGGGGGPLRFGQLMALSQHRSHHHNNDSCSSSSTAALSLLCSYESGHVVGLLSPPTGGDAALGLWTDSFNNQTTALRKGKWTAMFCIRCFAEPIVALCSLTFSSSFGTPSLTHLLCREAEEDSGVGPVLQQQQQAKSARIATFAVASAEGEIQCWGTTSPNPQQQQPQQQVSLQWSVKAQKGISQLAWLAPLIVGAACWDGTLRLLALGGPHDDQSNRRQTEGVRVTSPHEEDLDQQQRSSAVDAGGAVVTVLTTHNEKDVGATALQSIQWIPSRREWRRTALVRRKQPYHDDNDDLRTFPRVVAYATATRSSLSGGGRTQTKQDSQQTLVFGSSGGDGAVCVWRIQLEG